jgi:TRAP-type C4-dicarboxylate transport system permease small subunit
MIFIWDLFETREEVRIHMNKKVIKTLDKIEDNILVAMFVAMVGIIFFQVIMRYVFNNSLSWSEELGKFLFVWLSWLGISIGHRRREHIKITLFVDRLSPKAKRLSEIVSELILIVICGVTMVHSFTMIGIQLNIPYAGIKISTAWGYLSVALGCGLFILRAIMHIAEDVSYIRKGDVVGGDQ